MSDQPYFPESEHELDRLIKKTDSSAVMEQARWAGLQPGMRVLDIGCGPGVTTAALAECVEPGGRVVGVDRSAERIAFAKEEYGNGNIHFTCRNFFHDLSDFGTFDFIWIRFVLEYFLKEAPELVKHVTGSLRPGGILCLADLDNNCLIHHDPPERLNHTFQKLTEAQIQNNNFDPYAGRKLYSYLYDQKFTDIRIDIRMHHLIYGELSEFDRWNWWHKIEVGARRSGWTFENYADGINGFEQEFKDYFSDPRRFTYTPLILARGIKTA